MSSEDAMGGRAGSAPLSSAATASEVEGVAQEAPPPAARPVRVLVSPVAADGSSAAGTVLPPAYSGVLYLQQRNDEWPPMRGQQQGEDGDDPKKMRAKWFNDMRGWLMVVAVQVASVTYQTGLDPPDGFDGKLSAGTSVLESPFPKTKR